MTDFIERSLRRLGGQFAGHAALELTATRELRGLGHEAFKSTPTWPVVRSIYPNSGRFSQLWLPTIFQFGCMRLVPPMTDYKSEPRSRYEMCFAGCLTHLYRRPRACHRAGDSRTRWFAGTTWIMLPTTPRRLRIQYSKG